MFDKLKIFHFSPITRRRLHSFRHNRRAFVSLILFISLFVVTLFSEIIANDKPILVKYDQHYYFPFLFFYAETEFGGDYMTEALYHDEFVINLIEEKGWILWPPFPTKYDNVQQYDAAQNLSKPSWNHPLGTDGNNRDFFARMIYGFRYSIVFSVTLVFFAYILGLVLGAVQGYFGGLFDMVAQRGIEIWSSMPQLFIVIITSSFFYPTFWSILCVLLLFQWVGIERLVRAEFFRARNFDYIKAARAMGVRSHKIIFKHILPNAMVSSVTYLPFMLTSGILLLTTLDFLGFGMPNHMPSIGDMVKQAKDNWDAAPWLAFSTFVMMTITLSLLVFIGEGVRDAFDPKKTFNG